MNDDMSVSGRGINRIEQHVRDDLYKFTSEGQYGSIRLKALMYDNSLPLSLGTVKVRYLAEHRIQFEFFRLVAVTVELERMCGNATQSLQLLFQCGDVSPRLGSGLERSQQIHQIHHCF